MSKYELPQCAVVGCQNLADPRWYAHGPDGALVMVCDGHSELPCEGNPCMCPPTLQKKALPIEQDEAKHE